MPFEVILNPDNLLFAPNVSPRISLYHTCENSCILLGLLSNSLVSTSNFVWLRTSHVIFREKLRPKKKKNCEPVIGTVKVLKLFKFPIQSNLGPKRWILPRILPHFGGNIF